MNHMLNSQMTSTENGVENHFNGIRLQYNRNIFQGHNSSGETGKLWFIEATLAH